MNPNTGTQPAGTPTTRPAERDTDRKTALAALREMPLDIRRPVPEVAKPARRPEPPPVIPWLNWGIND